MSLSPIATNIYEAFHGVLLNSPVGQVVDDALDVLDSLEMLDAIALGAIARLEAKYNLGPEVSVLLRSKLTADGAHAAQVQADALEAARLAELAGAK